MILVIAGTRPEAIKVAPIISELRKRSNLSSHLLHTGQHEGLTESVADYFDASPDSSLRLLRRSQSLSEMGSRALRLIGAVVDYVNPKIVMVQGDTASTFFGALAAYNQGVPVVHLEAGLRTHNLDAPFPEEGYRQMVSRVSIHHFAPTPRASENLLAEGIDQQSISIVGNSSVDVSSKVLRHFKEFPEKKRALWEELLNVFGSEVKEGLFVLITVHRRENQGTPLDRIAEAVRALARQYPELHFIWVLHPNPKLQSRVGELVEHIPNVRVVRPLIFLHMAVALDACLFVITDSGGIQEEAPSFSKYSLVVRESTERPEAVEKELSWLVGSEPERIISNSSSLISALGQTEDKRVAFANNPFGDGFTAGRVVDWLEEFDVQA